MTRQEVFFLGAPAGSADFLPPKMPVWLHRTHSGLPYALPDIEGGDSKLLLTVTGDRFDPDSGMRVAAESSIIFCAHTCGSTYRNWSTAPVLETRVCQYENTWNGDFLD